MPVVTTANSASEIPTLATANKHHSTSKAPAFTTASSLHSAGFLVSSESSDHNSIDVSFIEVHPSSTSSFIPSFFAYSAICNLVDNLRGNGIILRMKGGV